MLIFLILFVEGFDANCHLFETFIDLLLDLAIRHCVDEGLGRSERCIRYVGETRMWEEKSSPVMGVGSRIYLDEANAFSSGDQVKSKAMSLLLEHLAAAANTCGVRDNTPPRNARVLDTSGCYLRVFDVHLTLSISRI